MAIYLNVLIYMTSLTVQEFMLGVADTTETVDQAVTRTQVKKMTFSRIFFFFFKINRFDISTEQHTIPIGLKLVNM